MYYVIQTITSGLDSAETATIIGRHRTRDAAERKIARANRRLRTQPGMSQSWVPWSTVPASALSAQKRSSYRAK